MKDSKGDLLSTEQLQEILAAHQKWINNEEGGRRANLRYADLRGASLYGANLTPIKSDLWTVLSAAPAEVRELRQALIEGRVDGSCYEGECACLVGTIANIRHTTYRDMPGIIPDSNRPIERFFLGISKGDTPATNQCSALVVEWIDEWLTHTEQAIAGRGE